MVSLAAAGRGQDRAGCWAGVALAGATFLVLVSGQLDVAGQILLSSGLYAIWCWIDAYIKPLAERFLRGLPAAGSVRAKARLPPPQSTGQTPVPPSPSGGPPRRCCLAACWGLGFLLAGPDLLPLLEYTHTGARMARRSEGEEERKPWPARLAANVLPDMYGTYQRDSFLIYLPRPIQSIGSRRRWRMRGLLATLLVRSLAWCSRRHRSFNIIWLVLGVLGVAWLLDVPGLVRMIAAAGAQYAVHNRFVFVTSFAILAMAAEGLDGARAGRRAAAPWFWLPTALVAMLFLWCLFRIVVLPEPFATALETFVVHRQPVQWITDLAGVQSARRRFGRIRRGRPAWPVALAGWLLLDFQVRLRRWVVPLVGLLLVADLLCFGHGRNEQCDWSLYYPPLPILGKLAKEAKEESAVHRLRLFAAGPEREVPVARRPRLRRR